MHTIGRLTSYLFWIFLILPSLFSFNDVLSTTPALQPAHRRESQAPQPAPQPEPEPEVPSSQAPSSQAPQPAPQPEPEPEPQAPQPAPQPEPEPQPAPQPEPEPQARESNGEREQELEPDSRIPSIVRQFFSDETIDVFNQNTGASLTRHRFVESVPDKYAEQVLKIPGQFVTTLAFQDRYGRDDSNDNLNVFLQITHTNDRISSMRGIQLGGDSIQIISANGGNTILPRSGEIQIPAGQFIAVPQKTRDVWNQDLEPEETPNPIKDLLDTKIDLLNKATNEHLTHYKLVESVPDKYAEQVLKIPGQFVTTLAFQDRYGRDDSNDNLNVFLQITHTNDDVASLRGVQLGGDDIQVIVNSVDQGNVIKTVEIHQ